MSAVLEESERKQFIGVVLGSAVNSPATTLESPWQQGLGEAHSARRNIYYAIASRPAHHGGHELRAISYFGTSVSGRAISPYTTVCLDDFAWHSDRRDPFDQLRDGKAAASKVLINDWQQSGRVSLALASRLIALIDMAADEYPETEIPGAQMLESVLGFFRSRREIIAPALTLTPSGHVWAQWAAGERAAVIEFRRDGSVNLVAFFPDPEEPLRPASIANNLSWKAASREIRSNHSLRWLLAD